MTDNNIRRQTDYSYAYDDMAGSFVCNVIQEVPSRWGRMTPLCRAMIVETALLLGEHNLLEKGLSQLQQEKTIGLIGAGRWGSHATDMGFAASMKDDVLFASPALFGYTLANIPLAEAANHFDLVGPVYALIDNDAPFEAAKNEAQLLLEFNRNIDMMLACSFDATYSTSHTEMISITFTLLQRP